MFCLRVKQYSCHNFPWKFPKLCLIPQQTNITFILKLFSDQQKQNKTQHPVLSIKLLSLTKCLIVFSVITSRKKNYFIISSLSLRVQYSAYHIKIFCMLASQRGNKRSVCWLMACRLFVLILQVIFEVLKLLLNYHVTKF